MASYLKAGVRQVQEGEVSNGGNGGRYDRVKPHAHTQHKGI